MATPVQETGRMHLPARIRLRTTPENGFSSRLALAHRIAELPDTQTVENGADTLPCCVEVYLRRQPESLRKQQAPLLLCSISSAGVVIRGLCNRDKHQVLSRGWGKLERDHVLIFLPRDEMELEVCWSILQRAYDSLSVASVRTPLMRTASTWDLPRFSRTPLQ
jgi:hypothetical protein